MIDRLFRVKHQKKDKYFLVRENETGKFSCDCSVWLSRNVLSKTDCEHILQVKLSIIAKDQAISNMIDEMKSSGSISEKTKIAYVEASQFNFSNICSAKIPKRKITF